MSNGKGGFPGGKMPDLGARMKQAQKLLQKMEHRLSGLSARKRLDATVRSGFVGTIHTLRTDVGALRKNPCS